MRVLVAPDKFKGTLSAAEAAEAISTGWRRADPRAELDEAPLADGGEGTLDAMLAALGGTRFSARVTGPLGDPAMADYGVVAERDGGLGIVEMARASGLQLVPAAGRDAKRATTRGTGELILEACGRGVAEVVVCIGGSATNDGGAGMAQALGVRLLDDQGRDLPPGGAALVGLARIDLSGLDPRVGRTRFLVATDVDNPLIGPHGASAVYGPQKGASPEDVLLLDRALGHLAAVIHRDLGIDLRSTPGAGAAGGLGAGLMAFLGAHLRPGVEVVMEAVGLRERLAGADLLVTGEGSFDRQSLHGKAPAGAMGAAAEAGVPVVIVCGQAEPKAVDEVTRGGAGARVLRVASLAERFGMHEALGRARARLSDLTEEVAAEMVGRSSAGRA